MSTVDASGVTETGKWGVLLAADLSSKMLRQMGRPMSPRTREVTKAAVLALVIMPDELPEEAFRMLLSLVAGADAALGVVLTQAAEGKVEVGVEEVAHLQEKRAMTAQALAELGQLAFTSGIEVPTFD